MKLFKNAQLLTCKDQTSPWEGALLENNGRIEEVLDQRSALAYEAQNKVETVDCAGQYLMPGLIDCHVHLFLEPNNWDRMAMYQRSDTVNVMDALYRVQQMTKAGVTTFRDCGGYKNLEFELVGKLYEEKDWCLSEGILAGSALCISGGHGWWFSKQCNGAEAFVKGLRENLRDGADFIKIMLTGGYARPKMRVNHGDVSCPPQMTLAEAVAAADETHRLGRKISAHCIGLEGLKIAAEAGLDSVEHAQFHDPYAKDVDAVIEVMLKKQMVVVPTLAAYYKNYDKATVRKEYETVDQSLMRYYKAGVKIALGTDAGCPFVEHNQAPVEVKHQIEAGMSPMDSILSATKYAAELLGMTAHCGTLEKGKKADFLILKENPLTNIDTLQDLAAVYKSGVLVR